MKKVFLTHFLLVMFLLVGLSTKAQTTPNLVLSYLPLAPCSSLPVQFSLADLNGVINVQNTWASWDFGDGSNFYSPGNSVSHIYAPGNYLACATVYDSMTNIADTACIFFTVDTGCPPSDFFEGTVYFDFNGNGIQDFNENGIPYSMVQVSPIGFTVSCDANGNFSIPLPAGSFTLSCTPLQFYVVSQPSGNNYSITSTASGATTTNLDFGMNPIPGQRDLELNIWSPTAHRPGFSGYLFVDFRNLGTQAESGSISVALDPNVTFSSATNGGTFSAGVVTFNFAGLYPNSLRWFVIYFTTSPTATLGSTITYTGVINPVAGDLVPSNNYDTLAVQVVASWDPNDKTSVAPGMGPNGEINAGDELTYTIRFQNEGNFPATFIYIRDTLDPNLDRSSFRIVSASHAMTHTQNSDQIQFYFDQIHLVPKSQDEAASQGFVRYSIKAKNNLAPGDEIRNTASIYFDYNPAVVTNTTLNSVWIPTALEDEMNPMEIELFPNPMAERATLRFDAGGESWDLKVTDLQGRTVMERRHETTGHIEILRGELAAGTYLFQLVSDAGKMATGRMIVE